MTVKILAHPAQDQVPHVFRAQHDIVRAFATAIDTSIGVNLITRRGELDNQDLLAVHCNGIGRDIGCQGWATRSSSRDYTTPDHINALNSYNLTCVSHPE